VKSELAKTWTETGKVFKVLPYLSQRVTEEYCGVLAEIPSDKNT
jgi:hypothetical protein